MLHGGGRASCGGFLVVWTVVCDREVFSDGEVVALGRGDGRQHLTLRRVDVADGVLGGAGGCEKYLVLGADDGDVTGDSVQRGVFRVALPGCATRGRDVLPMLIEGVLRRLGCRTPAGRGVSKMTGGPGLDLRTRGYGDRRGSRAHTSTDVMASDPSESVRA